MVTILNMHELAQLRLVEVLDGDSQLRQTHELFPINPRRVCEHATAIYDGDRLIGTEQDFICTRRTCGRRPISTFNDKM
jgi:hypothetical protein